MVAGKDIDFAEQPQPGYAGAPLLRALGSRIGMKRYSANLLFQYRADLGRGRSDIMRRCEERIIVLTALNAESALRKAKVHGTKAQFTSTTEAGNALYFEFIGVTDLLELGIECLPEEVWYGISIRKQPMEQKNKIIPPEKKLNAIFWEQKSQRKPPTTPPTLRRVPRRK